MRKYFTLILIATIALTTGCSNGDKADNESGIVLEDATEKKEITEFNALGNVYKVGKDISSFEEGSDIFDINTVPYVEGEYLEADFALDLVENYLGANYSIYDSLVSIEDGIYKPISEEDKNRNIESLNYLQRQYWLEEDDKIYFKLSKITYLGPGEVEDSVDLEVKGLISSNGEYFKSLMEYKITIIKEGNKILAQLS